MIDTPEPVPPNELKTVGTKGMTLRLCMEIRLSPTSLNPTVHRSWVCEPVTNGNNNNHNNDHNNHNHHNDNDDDYNDSGGDNWG